MGLIPEHVASQREQRDTRVVIKVEAGLAVAGLLVGLAGYPVGLVCALVFGLLAIWMWAMHMLGPRA